MEPSNFTKENHFASNENLSFDCKNNINSQKIITNLVQSSFLFGADKVLMAQRSRKLMRFDSDSCQECGVNKNLSGKLPTNHMVKSSSLRSMEAKVDYDDEFLDVSKVVNSPSGGFNEFPLNILGSLTILFIKFFGFQMNLFVRFFTLPIWFAYFSFMFILFPFQTLSRIRRHLTNMILGMWVSIYLSLASFICERINAQTSLVKMGVRFGWAFLSAIYVFFILLGMLLSGFVIGGFVMKRLVEKPIMAQETLNFDYTIASPVAHVPFSSSTSLGKTGAENGGTRAIPYNHKLQLLVSLTMPESEYNRKLGVFQVRVDFLSANGKTTASASYPCMMRFKSQPIRIIETVFNAVPLITGFQSEVQNLNVKIDEFTEGKEATTGLKVVLEQRAVYQSGAGIPEIYGASLHLRSELPQIKKALWAWRKTVFVWISMMSFIFQLFVVLICYRVLVPKGKLTEIKAKKQNNKISWY